MKFEMHLPCARLQPFIKHLVISETDEGRIYPVLPDTGLVMGFQYKGRLAYVEGGQEHSLATAGITGLTDSYRIFRNGPDTGTVLVVFRETAVSHFIAHPVHELFGKSLPLEHFFIPQAIRDMEEQLAETLADTERLRLVEDFLISHLTDRREDLLVLRALQHIHHSKGTVRISELASALHSSQSPLEKRFRSVTGASPKKFATIVRAKNMMEALQQNNLEKAHYLSSFYDQAHFIKEFKKFTAATPEQYLRSLRTTRISK